jgi:hypothetical protein
MRSLAGLGPHPHSVTCAPKIETGDQITRGPFAHSTDLRADESRRCHSPDLQKHLGCFYCALGEAPAAWEPNSGKRRWMKL